MATKQKNTNKYNTKIDESLDKYSGKIISKEKSEIAKKNMKAALSVVEKFRKSPQYSLSLKSK